MARRHRSVPHRNAPSRNPRPLLMTTYLWVALGSALGGVARVWLSGVVARQFSHTVPFGTLLVNVSGSFLIGFIVAFTGPDGRLPISPTVRTFLTLGVLGGYTTFSSFSLQTLNLARDGQWLAAGWNIALSIVLCLVAVAIGHAAGLFFTSTKGP